MVVWCHEKTNQYHFWWGCNLLNLGFEGCEWGLCYFSRFIKYMNESLDMIDQVLIDLGIGNLEV